MEWVILILFVLVFIGIAGNVSEHNKEQEKLASMSPEEQQKYLEEKQIRSNRTQEEDRLATLLIMLNNQEDFKTSDYFMWAGIGIAIDTQSKQICLINVKLPIESTTFKLIQYSDIIQSEIIAGNTITKTSRTSQLAGVAVGGLLLGGAGAVIGGLSGKKETSSSFKDISLKILINDTSNPVHLISEIPKIHLQKAQKWHDLLSVIIKQADQFKAETVQASFADQITQLSELHKSGTLTNDEFTNAKMKLLGKVGKMSSDVENTQI